MKDNKGRFVKGHIPQNPIKKGEHRGTKTEFKKGMISWCKGTKGIMKPNKTSFKKDIPSAFKGKYHTDEAKRKLSIACKGRKLTEEHKRKMSDYNQRPEIKKRFKERMKYVVVPKKDSSIEVKIQNYLRRLKIDFFTHQYMKDIEHGYQCDIFIPVMELIIECDGDYWHKYPVGRDIDNIRTKELIEKGFKVLRLWEREIRVMNIDDFRERLFK